MTPGPVPTSGYAYGFCKTPPDDLPEDMLKLHQVDGRVGKVAEDLVAFR